MKTNAVRKSEPVYTHGGGRAVRMPSEELLRRAVMSCMLWEDSFYEDGEPIAKRIANLVADIPLEKVSQIAIEARSQHNLRHAPLWIARQMAYRSGNGVIADTIATVIQRPDELAEFLSLYWKDGRAPLSAQVKKGLAKAFGKFSAYQLAKYNQDRDVKLRDVMFLAHPKPNDAKGRTKYTKAQRKQGVKPPTGVGELFEKLVKGTLETPDTWEVALSAGKDKKEEFVRLMEEKKLGALAFIRNLRNMNEAKVPRKLVEAYAKSVNLDRVLPFRYIAAARACPSWEDICDTMLLRGCSNAPRIPGKTVVIVDVSGSMNYGKVSGKSDMTRLDAAGALAAILRESCEEVVLYATAGDDGRYKHATMLVPPRRGLALVDLFTGHKFASEIGQGGIFLKQVMSWVKDREGSADRVVVLTDEQDCDRLATGQKVDTFGKRNYLLNVSVEQNGIVFGNDWTRVNGFSEAVVNYIREDAKARN